MLFKIYAFARFITQTLNTTNISRKDSNESRNAVGVADGMVKIDLRVNQLDFDVDSETPGNGEATEQDTGIYYSLRGTPRETPKGTPRTRGSRRFV